MNRILIRDATIINENLIRKASVLIENEWIKDIFFENIPDSVLLTSKIIDAKNKFLIPGLIDDQVHFRTPGLTHKGDIYSESKAAVAGGITSYMDMPNVKPPTITQILLEEKILHASKNSLANYSFYFGATNDNTDEIVACDPSQVCGIKVFLGASTGNMLVDNKETLNKIFSLSNQLIAVHCEDENIINTNLSIYKDIYGENIPIKYHPKIRSKEACFNSSLFAINLAKKHNARLHILHLSTAKEMDLLSNQSIENKRITSEVCVHHLTFDDGDYKKLGTKIKWNPAIKTKEDKQALLQAVLDDKIDIIATDHAPHTITEKQNPYTMAPSGGPLVQHSLNAMLELYEAKKISLEKIVEKMCHAPAKIFNVNKRGFIRKGYYADICLFEKKKWTVTKSNILYKCGWSPFEGRKFNFNVSHTFVNGNLVFHKGNFDENYRGKLLEFET